VLHFYFRKSFAVVLIVLGIVAIATPLTPGAWLIPLGVAVLIGKDRAFAWSKRIFGQRWHDKMRVEKFLHFFMREKKK